MTITITDASPWTERAIWWSPLWAYRLPVDVAANVALVDGVIGIAVDWVTVLASVGITGTSADIDPDSLRFVEYTPGGHVTTPALTTLSISTLTIQRFDRCPVSVYRGDISDLRALVPGLTAQGVTRHFFLYFDLTTSPKAAFDAHYLTAVQDAVRITIQRVGPDNEYTNAHAGAWQLPSDAGPFASNLSLNASNQAYTFQNLAIAANTQYTLSFWVKTSGIAVGNGIRMLYGAFGNLHYTTWTAGTQDWTLVTLIFTSPADTSVGGVQIIYDLRAGEMAWVDDVSLAPTAGGGPEAVLNGDMELHTGTTPTDWAPRTAVSWDDTVSHGGTASMKIAAAADVFSINFPSADAGAFAGLLVTESTYVLEPDGGPLSQIDAVVSNSDGSITGTLSLDTLNRFTSNSYRLVTKGVLTLAPTTNLAVVSGQLLHLLSTISANGISSAWTGDTGTNLPAGTPTALSVGTIVGVNSGVVAALRVDALTLPAVLGSAMSVLRTTATRMVDISVAAPGNGTWTTGDPLVLEFTLLGCPVSDTAANVAALLASYAPGAATVTADTPSAYSLDLLDAQMVYYVEDKAWGWVENEQITHGWGLPWNIGWRHDKKLDPTNLYPNTSFLVAHDNDSSMGNGFDLYAACLMAALTGEARYYQMADAFASYFLEIDAEDVLNYPLESPPVTGRIPHFFNGGPSTINSPLVTPPMTCLNESSSDQMSTSAMGIWFYVHLDPDQISYKTEAEQLLGRMANYMNVGGPNVPASPALLNLGTMLQLPGFSGWHGTQLSPNPLGGFYSQWVIGNTCDLNTGGSANTFFVGKLADSLLTHKDTGKLADRTSYMTHDVPTSAIGLYNVIHGTSYTASWGYQDNVEFPIIGNLQSVTNGLVTVSPGVFHQFIGRGGYSGRSSEGAAALAYAIAEYPGSFVTVQLDNTYMLIEDFVRHIIHAAIAINQDDDGAICEAGVGTLGTASNVTYYLQATDETAYLLTAWALYRALVLRRTANPFPASGHDYLQGISEAAGVVRAWYLGDLALSQDWTVPRTDRPLLCTGIIATPTLTFDTAGEAAELAGNAVALDATLVLQQYASGTVQQIPIAIVPDMGTVTVTPTSWTPSGGTVSMSTDLGQTVAFTVFTTEGTAVEITRGTQVVIGVADAQGEFTAQLIGDGLTLPVVVTETTVARGFIVRGAAA